MKNRRRIVFVLIVLALVASIAAEVAGFFLR
jgi:hypothetical protein